MLPCMNCQEMVDPKSAKFFAGVFVCPGCFGLADRFYQKGAEDLKGLLLMLQESIRVALVRGELKLGTAEPLRDLSKKEVLEQIVKLREKMDARRSPPDDAHPPGQSGSTRGPGAQVRRLGSR
jgi:hypothetical protein